jgi:NAD(P)-dependent dehydrogenase (short-subunit alcohol dehydrogenase family)
MKLDGKGIVITGANQGLGKEIARACVVEGAHVLLCARDSILLEEAGEELRSTASDRQRIFTQVADVSRGDMVENLISRSGELLPHIDGVVNNAGIYGPMGLVETTDWEEWVRTVEINLLGTVLVCRAVLPIFRRQGHGKIINVSGGGATAPMPRFSAYAASKAAVVRFTETLAEEVKSIGIDVNAIAPGGLNTRLLDEVLAAGPTKVGEQFYERSLTQRDNGGESPAKAAALCVFLLSAESTGISGKLLSAVWDPWLSLSQHQQELQQTDVYTLRRIVPRDRGLDWE